MLDFLRPHDIQKDRSSERFCSSKTSFEKQLRWLVMNPPDHPIPIKVTPMMAEEVLKFLPPDDGRIRQRGQSESVVSRYAEEMRSGRWRKTQIPILFSKSGHLADGQHRMQAVVKSCTSQTFYFGFGEEDENFFVYDIGDVRDAADIFTIKGVPNASQSAAVTRFVHSYLESHSSGMRARTVVLDTPEKVYEYYVDHPGIHESLWVVGAASKYGICVPTTIGGLHYLCAQKSRKDADEFFKKLTTGIGFASTRDPAHKLRERLARKSEFESRLDPACMVINCWNSIRQRKRTSTLKGCKDGVFPRIV